MSITFLKAVAISLKHTVVLFSSWKKINLQNQVTYKIIVSGELKQHNYAWC